MDPVTRLEVDAWLRDIWEGTDFEVALARTNLVVRLKTSEEQLDDVDQRIDNAVGHVLEMVMDVAKASAVEVKEHWGDPPYKAVSLDELTNILDEIQEYPDE